MVGPITRYENLKECLLKVPLDKLVIETDAPLLPPLPYDKTTRNDSTMLDLVVKEISNIINIDDNEIIKITNENAKRIFNI